jgi:hypothetical protein
VTTWRYIPEDSKLHTHSCENLKAHKTLTLAEKISLLQDLDKKSESKGKLALKYSIPNSSLSSILKNQQEIEEDFYNSKWSTIGQHSWPTMYKEHEGKFFEYISSSTCSEYANYRPNAY